MGAVGRFSKEATANHSAKQKRTEKTEPHHYQMLHPGLLWNAEHGDPLPADGGETRPRSNRNRPHQHPEKRPTAAEETP